MLASSGCCATSGDGIMSNAQRECSNMITLLRANADLRDGHPDRGGVTSLEHALQMADRARKAELSATWVGIALIHDAAKPLTERWHGQAMAYMVREYAPQEAQHYLRNHSVQAYGSAPSQLGLLDAASFDPDYPTPSLDELVPYLEVLYGLPRPW